MSSQTLVVEIGNDHNDMIMFDPLQKWLRGRWQKSGLSPGERSTSHDPRQVPDLPGLHVEVDANGHEARVFDPLSQDGHRETMANLNALLKKRNQPETQPMDTQDFRGMSDEQIASWVYHLRRLVDKGDATVVQGDITKQPKGRIKQCYFQPGHLGEPVYKDEFEARESLGRDWQRLLREDPSLAEARA